MGFSTKVILAFAAIVIAALAVMFLWRSPGAAELERYVRELERLVRAGDVAGCMSHVYENYDHNGRNYDEMDKLARTYVGGRGYNDVTVREIEGEAHGDDAQVRFEADVAAEFLERKVVQTYGVQLFLRRFGGAWKIVGFEVVARERSFP